MEIEIKIPITKEKFDSLVNDFILSGKKSIKTINKEDTYFSMYPDRASRISNKEPLIRIRNENETESYLTYKIKSTVDGIETNVERETRLDDGAVVRELFDKLGFNQWFHKKKYSYFIKDTVNGIDFHTEIETVNDRLYYVEIENVEVSADVGKDKIIEAMKELTVQYGLNFDDRDGRDWPTILS